MRINLHEIPEEGKKFLWNEKTKEITRELSDLIGSSAHIADFFIKPINSKDFQVVGTIKTQLPEACSRCGKDFEFPVHQKFHEILIPAQPEDRTGKYAKVNHISEAAVAGPSVTEYGANQTFEMGEYLHEQVAIALPFNPAPPEKANGDCSLCDIPVRGRVFTYNEDMPEEKVENPFEVLKNLSLPKR